MSAHKHVTRMQAFKITDINILTIQTSVYIYFFVHGFVLVYFELYFTFHTGTSRSKIRYFLFFVNGST